MRKYTLTFRCLHFVACVVVAIYVKTVPAFAQEASIISAIYFDDGNDKQAVNDLRRKSLGGEALTEEEQAIVRAAAKTGMVGCKKESGGTTSSNGFIVKIDGRDAIITSQHAFIISAYRALFSDEPAIRSDEIGMHLCIPNSYYYMPNVSYIDSRQDLPNNFFTKKIAITAEVPLNSEITTGQITMAAVHDFLIFFLSDDNQASGDVLPDGTVRGHFEFANDFPEAGELFLIGTEPRFRKGVVSAWQKCRYQTGTGHSLFGVYPDGEIHHDCDTVKGASSSVLAIYDGKDLLFAGMHVRGKEGDAEASDEYYDWNLGLSSTNVSRYIATGKP